MPPEPVPDNIDGFNKPRSPWKIGAVDALLLLLLLGLANGLIARDDPGFLGLNPTPWILLPLILGTRLGLVAGQIGALLAAVSVFAGFHFWAGRSDIPALVTDHPYFFVSLLAAGAIGGLVHVLLVGPAKTARNRARQLEHSSTRLQHELNLTQESEDELARRLLLHGAEFVSLQDRVRQLFMPQSGAAAEGVERGFLEILRENFDVSGAAIYHCDNSGSGAQWQRSAFLGDAGSYQESCQFDAADHPIAAAAIEHRDLATCATLWAGETVDAPLSRAESSTLAAIPWSATATSQTVRLLTIDRLPFATVNWETLGRIQALFDWVMSVASANQGSNGATKPSDDTPPAADAGPLLDPEEFSRQIDLALTNAMRSNVTYRLAVFEPTPEASATSQQAFLKRFLADRRPGDNIGGVNLGGSSNAYAIGLLMPAASDTSAECRIADILRDVPDGEASVRHQILTIDNDADRFNQQWNQLIQPACVAP